MRAPFIVFEGIDGSGKSTASKYFKDALMAKGIQVALTCEPTKFDIGQLIRKCISGTEHDAKQLLFMFMADRCYHNVQINASLDSGWVVICDRYSLSSRIYQDGVVEDQLLEKLCTNNQFNIKADLMIYTTASTKTLVERISKRVDKDIFETEKMLEINRKKYSGVLSSSHSLLYANNVESVDSESGIEQMYTQLDSIVESYWLMFSEFVKPF